MHSIFLPSQTRSMATALVVAGVSVARGGPRVPPLPLDQWPIWAKAIAHRRQPQDTGLGDTVVHLIGAARSEAFKTWFTQTFGKSCGCTERQRWLNARFPYPPQPPKTPAADILQGI